MIIDGKQMAALIRAEIRKEVVELKGRPPSLAVLLVGKNPASEIYVKRKMEACREVGIHSLLLEFPETVAEQELIDVMDRLNHDKGIDGILVQMPLPAHVSAKKLMEVISPQKDVDGFHPVNVGKVWMEDTSGFVPCTPLAIREMLERLKIPLAGRHVAILGRSLIVGKPLAALLLQKRCNATVTLLHSASQNAASICRSADIVIGCAGSPRLITADYIKKGAVVIDVGITRLKEGLVGDVDFEGVAPLASFITPVPGGVGPMTIAMLLRNTLHAFSCKL